MGVGQDLLDVPFPEMVEKLASGIAEAQFKLDLKSLQIAQLMAGQDVYARQPDPENPSKLVAVKVMGAQMIPFGKTHDGEVATFTLLELGFTPSFYQFVDTIIEVKMSISMTSSSEYSTSFSSTTTTKGSFGGWFSPVKGSVANTTSVSASFSAKYQYHAEGSSLLRTKLAPVPPPAVLEERIRLLMENDGKYPKLPKVESEKSSDVKDATK